MNIKLKSDFTLGYMDLIQGLREDLEKEKRLFGPTKTRAIELIDELENILEPIAIESEQKD